MSAALKSLDAGESILGFTIERTLGAGGFGIVYLGFNPGLEEYCAIKEFYPRDISRRQGSTIIVTDESHQDLFDSVLRKFEDTTRLLKRLDHPNIVRVYGYERRNNTAYMSMQYIDGRDLKSWLTVGEVTPETFRGIFEPIARALDYMHGQSLIHRDISPLNIMLTGTHQVPMLIDFGTLKHQYRDAALAQRAEEERSGHTVLTTVPIANPRYAPPEQINRSLSGQQGPWTDIYALCATMYEVLAGRPPASAQDRTDARLHQDMDVYDTIATASRIPLATRWAEAIDAGLSLRIRERPPSIAALLDGFGWTEPVVPPEPPQPPQPPPVRITDLPPEPPVVPPPRWRRPQVVLPGLAAGLLLAVVLATMNGGDERLAQTADACVRAVDPCRAGADEALDACTSAYGRASASHPRAAVLAAAAAEQLARCALPDGTYTGERGYDNPVKGICQASFRIDRIRIDHGSIDFDSGRMAWHGSIDQATGEIAIETSGITPMPKTETTISGRYQSAVLRNGTCGTGYLRIHR